MSDLMKVSSNPHVRSKVTTSGIMLAVIIALLPATGFGIYNFGLDALILIVVTVASTVLTEYLFEKICKKKVTIGDYSAMVTGLLLALNLPASAPWWCVCHSGGKDVVWRAGSELYEPGIGRKVFPVNILYFYYDEF